MLGPKGNVHEYLVNSNIFVFPSVHEGLGIALIEAMAVGLACIASEMGPIPEYVSHDENGMLVTPKDPAGLAHALSELLMDPEKRTRLGKAARETALSLFQPLNAAKQLTEVYFSVARTHSVANGK